MEAAHAEGLHGLLPVRRRGLSPGGLQWPVPSSTPPWSPVQKQIQEEPLDSLLSSTRQQVMETLTQLR